MSDKKERLLNLLETVKDLPEEKVKDDEPKINPGESIALMLLDISKLRKKQKKAWSAKQHAAAARTVRIYCQEKGSTIETVKEALKLEGIGSGIAKKIGEFIKTGKVKELEEYYAQLGEEDKGIENLTAIWGVGDVTANKWLKMGIENIEQVREAVKGRKIKPTSQQKMGINYYEDFKKKMNRAQMKRIGQCLCDALKQVTDEYGVKICGSYRRKKEESKDADIVIFPKVDKPKISNKKLLEKVVEYIEEPLEELSFGDSSLFGVIQIEGIHRRFDCWVCTKEQIPFAFLAWTGSGQFNVEIRKSAMKHGWKLTDKDLTDENGDDVLLDGNPLESERDIFEVIGRKYISPSKRE